MIQTIESELSEELKRGEYISLSRLLVACQCTILVRKILGMPSLQWTTALGFEVIPSCSMMSSRILMGIVSYRDEKSG